MAAAQHRGLGRHAPHRRRAAASWSTGCATRSGPSGPLTAAEIEHDAPRETNNWGWNWSAVKRALEFLFWAGEVAAAERNAAFARLYDLPERVLPAGACWPRRRRPDAEAYRAAGRASPRGRSGVAAEPELRDYFRLPLAERPHRDRRAGRGR